MAALWERSLIPFTDPNGDPYAGALAYFYDAGTTTPRATYVGSDLAVPHDHPVVANASGAFPPIFIEPGDYRLRIETADGVTLWDVDGISAPVVTTTSDGSGDVNAKLLKQTGEYGFFHATGAVAGYVRANGRTIGNGASGATERANDDCEALFEFLWAQDATLTVSGGRGVSAATDWAAGKTITLPSAQSRALIGMSAMGGADVGLIGASAIDDGETADTLGATLGAATHTLTVAQMPTHNHSGTTSTDGSHVHAGFYGSQSSGSYNTSGSQVSGYANSTSSAGAHSHSYETTSAGSGASHNNMQPSLIVGIYIKL